MQGTSPHRRGNIQKHPLARLLPKLGLQRQVYRLGESTPPSDGLEGFGPSWQAVDLVIPAYSAMQARVSVQRMFTVLGFAASASVNALGGFRLQMYDTKKGIRFAGRGVQYGNVAGAAKSAGPFFLREPYQFDLPDSQILVDCRNLEAAQNSIEIVIYGVALRFNQIQGDTSQ